MSELHLPSGGTTRGRDLSLDALHTLNRALDPEWDDTSEVLWQRGELSSEQKKRGIVVRAQDKFVAVKELPEFEVSIWTEHDLDLCFMVYPPHKELEFSPAPQEERLQVVIDQLAHLCRKAYDEARLVVIPQFFLHRDGSTRSTQHDPQHACMDIFQIRVARGTRTPRWDKTLAELLRTLNAILSGVETPLEG